MRNCLHLFMLALVGFFLGCDSAAPPASVSVANGPHRGTMIRLPDDKGFVELVNEPEVTDRRNPKPTSLVAYYLKTDAKSAIEPAPSEVRFEINSGRGRTGRETTGSPQSIPLIAEPKSDDPAGAGRFASKPGPYVLMGLRGSLSAKLDGQQVSTDFQGDR